MNICQKCVMDDQNDKYIYFDDQGICNYCKDYDDKKKSYSFTADEVKSNLKIIKKKINK